MGLQCRAEGTESGGKCPPDDTMRPQVPLQHVAVLGSRAGIAGIAAIAPQPGETPRGTKGAGDNKPKAIPSVLCRMCILGRFFPCPELQREPVSFLVLIFLLKPQGSTPSPCCPLHLLNTPGNPPSPDIQLIAELCPNLQLDLAQECARRWQGKWLY